MPTQQPTWPRATWVGEITVHPGQQQPPAGLQLPDGAGYSFARLMVREDGQVRGFVEVAVTDATVRADDVLRAVDALPAGEPALAPADGPLPAISVVVATRERPEALATLLPSLLAQQHPQFEIIVVDNAPLTSATADVVRNSDDPRLRLLTEPTQGVSNARNSGVRAARHEWVAFVDDDVVVDADWLSELAATIAHYDATTPVDAVAGPVPTGELRTPEQAWFDRRVSWNAVRRYVFDLAAPPAAIRFFPFQVGAYGTGANLAVRRAAFEDVGGFDPVMGAGVRTKGGEDIDLSYRLIVGGHRFAYEPSVFVWHRHRDSLEALQSQAVGYGRGLTAWLTKLVFTPRDLGRGLRCLARGARRSGGQDVPPALFTAVEHTEGLPAGHHLVSVERRAMLSGPPAYLRSRVAARRARSAER